jgi:GNAT superfamily N-acetyltransferase
MRLEVQIAPPEEVSPLRELHRAEMGCQILHDSWHGRGWTDSYLLRVAERVVGYGLVGGVPPNSKDRIVEFWVLPVHRAAALPLFRTLVRISRAKSIEAQTNDNLLTLMLYDCATAIESNTILFREAFTTDLAAPGALFRRAGPTERDRVFVHRVEPVGDWVIESAGEIAATGGMLCHYNPPFADIFMEVAAPFQRRGLGSFLVQELKRVCYEMGKIPAARCQASNVASRATLQKAGLLPCARILTGSIQV